MAGRILKKNKVGGLTLHNFRSSYKAIVNKRVWCWPDWNRMGNPEISSHIYHQLIFNEPAETI
jgi:hypothetical protein